tara:strand:- start:894 stop:1316 length:423 start_codon:yes stop_codon:yes gene_type:complete
MKRLLLLPLILGISAPANAGIYYYPSYQDGIEVRCKDGKPKHLLEITKSGRGMKLEGHGEDQYSWPITYLSPESPNEKYKYFPSTAGTQCSYRKLDKKERNSLILKAFKTCVGTEGDIKTELKIRKKNCFGWNEMNRSIP